MTSAPATLEAPAAAAWEEAAVRYPYQEAYAVGPVTLDLRQGERVLLLGPSGSGKSTLLNTLNGLVPEVIPADVEGSVSLLGRKASERTPAEWSDTVARLFQDANETLCGMTVGDEIAFALENRGLPETEIAEKVTAALARLDLPEDWRDRRSTALSGGEKQLVALAATLAQEAPVFLADEPTAHLAPAVAAKLRRLFAEFDRSGTLVVIDHRIDGLIESIDRVVAIGHDGRIAADGPPRRVFRHERQKLAVLGIWLPLSSHLDAKLAEAGLAAGTPPLSVEEALRPLGADAAPIIRTFVEDHMPPARASEPGDIAANLEAASCAPLFGPIVLRDVSLTVRRGEAVAILGRNGAGKSTLGASLAGLLRLKAGARRGPPGGMAFQNPESQFTGGSVADEILSSLPKGAPATAVDDILARWRLDGLATRHPYELSQGQKRRLALATLTAGDRFPLLVLDEPTAGLDAAGAETIARHVDELRQQGRAVALITHELDFALRTCPRAVFVGEGGILADGPTADLLADESLLARAGLEPPAIAPALAWLERHA